MAHMEVWHLAVAATSSPDPWDAAEHSRPVLGVQPDITTKASDILGARATGIPLVAGAFCSDNGTTPKKETPK